MPLYFLNAWNGAGYRLKRAERIGNISWWRKNVPKDQRQEVADQTADHIIEMRKILEQKGLEGIHENFNMEFPFIQDATPEGFISDPVEYSMSS